MTSQIARYTLPVGAAFIFHGTVFAGSPDLDCKRPDPAAIYADQDRLKDASCCKPKTQRDCKDTELEKLVMQARSELGPYKDCVMQYTSGGIKQANDYYEKLLDNLCYLRSGAPQEVKIGTIVVGGLTGMLLGIRGGLFKKLFMGTVGAGGGAYLAYPNETEKNVKKYSAIGWNFITGPRK